MINGKVKWFNFKKGYGFIRPEDGSNDVFVHISAIEDSGMTTLHENQKISFDIKSNGEKTAAVNLINLDC